MSQGNAATKRKKPPSSSPASLALAQAGAHSQSTPIYPGHDESQSLKQLIMENFKKSQERFDALESKIEFQLRETMHQVKDLEKKLTEVVVAVTSISMDTDKIEKEILPGMRKNIEEERMLLKMEIEKLNVYVARENVVFLGVPEEGTSEEPENTEAVIRKLLKGRMKMENEEVDGIEFQRIHRCPATTRPRPIKARLLRYGDKEMIMKNAKHLKGSKIVVTEDLPKAVREARRAQLPLLKAAKHVGKKAFFSRVEPRKLYIERKFIPISEQKAYLDELQRNAMEMENATPSQVQN